MPSPPPQVPHRASFTVRARPYTVAALVEFAQPLDTARMWVRAALDPVPIEARVMCSAPDGHGTWVEGPAVRRGRGGLRRPGWRSGADDPERYREVKGQARHRDSVPGLFRRCGFELAPI